MYVPHLLFSSQMHLLFFLFSNKVGLRDDRPLPFPHFFWTRTSYVDIRYFTISKFSLGKCSDLFSGYFPSPIWSSVLLFYISVKNGTVYIYWILVVTAYACSLIWFRNLFHLVLTLKHRAGSTAIAAEKRKQNRFVSQLGLRGSDPPI